MTDTPMASAPGPAPEKMGLFARLTGIYTAPTRVFQNLVERPRWIAIVMVVALAVGLLNFFMLSTETGETMMREQMEAQMRNSDFVQQDRRQMTEVEPHPHAVLTRNVRQAHGIPEAGRRARLRDRRLSAQRDQGDPVVIGRQRPDRGGGLGVP